MAASEIVDVVSTAPVSAGPASPPPGRDTGAPHRAQKRLSSGFCCPHWVQNTSVARLPISVRPARGTGWRAGLPVPATVVSGREKGQPFLEDSSR